MERRDGSTCSMGRVRGRSAGVVFLVNVVLAASAMAPAAADGWFGVNRVNIAWLPAVERENVLNTMAQNGVRSVRMSLTRPFRRSIDALRIAHARGLTILLEIPLNNPAFYQDEVAPRSGRGRIWDMYRLSDISPDRFRSVVGEALREIDRLEIPLIGVETGNELNWGAYNGDLEIRAQANSRTARSFAELSDTGAVRRGAAKYVTLLKVVRDELAMTKLSTRAKVISAGLSDIPLSDADRRGIDRVEPESFTALLREHGLDQAADGYGIHVYPGSSGSRSDREKHVRQALSICKEPPNGKPCWITEWGFANKAATCPVDDGLREQIIRETRALFKELMMKGRIAAAYYFDWDSTTPYGVWRCGELSSAGRQAVTP